jgi:hypothetical protein
LPVKQTDAAGAVLANFEEMVDRPSLPPQARRLLELARGEPEAASRAIGELSLEAQVALVCEAPLARRNELLELLPAPERVIPRIPEAELCFTIKAVGLADAPWILEHATPEQVVACIDLDAWSGTTPDREMLDAWLDALAETEGEAFLRSFRALDPEIAVIYLKGRIAVFLKPSDDDWQPPKGAQTLDGQFYFAARAEGDDVAAIVRLLHLLFEHEYWTYFRFMQGVVWEIDSVSEAWALRWRTGRLQDLGFPPWEEAMDIYRFLKPSERARLPEDARPLDVSEWHLPVWIPGLPATRDAEQLIFRTIALLDDDERRACFYAFTAIANKLAVADRMPLGDAESTPRAIEKAAHFISEGLAFVAAENRLQAAEVLRRAPLGRLFRVGANLDPERARP